MKLNKTNINAEVYQPVMDFVKQNGKPAIAFLAIMYVTKTFKDITDKAIDSGIVDKAIDNGMVPKLSYKNKNGEELSFGFSKPDSIVEEIVY